MTIVLSFFAVISRGARSPEVPSGAGRGAGGAPARRAGVRQKTGAERIHTSY
ncbi:hypothetical protein [Sorangium sp. So ce1335]|uniref:hypothetical protein n=1 Tax=Sorangium sp. So ce1335 TaxID=3133335 RepID=UPI003F5D6EFB